MNDAGVGTRATEAMDLLIEAVDQIPSAAWDQPSNLEGWSLAGAELDAARPSPEGEVPLHQALASPICGLAIHVWDVYRSQDRALELPDGLLGFCRQVAESVPEDKLRRPGGFGPAQPVAEDATPTARLMAYFGRPV
jgi:hypothetical protein